MPRRSPDGAGRRAGEDVCGRRVCGAPCSRPSSACRCARAGGGQAADGTGTLASCGSGVFEARGGLFVRPVMVCGARDFAGPLWVRMRGGDVGSGYATGRPWNLLRVRSWQILAGDFPRFYDIWILHVGQHLVTDLATSIILEVYRPRLLYALMTITRLLTYRC
jgi:hypothetical protein